MIRRLALAAAALGALWVSPAWAEQLLPGDTTDRAPKYATFRSLLFDAVARKDAAFLRSRSDDMRAPFDQPVGLAGFDLDNPEDPFWRLIARMLALGGTYHDSTQADPTGYVEYPYVTARFPAGYDTASHVVVVGRDVNVREKADPASKVVAKVSYEILPILDHGEPWQQVKVSDTLTGYVHQEYLYSPLDYRMTLRNVDGRWRIEFFGAGRM